MTGMNDRGVTGTESIYLRNREQTEEIHSVNTY